MIKKVREFAPATFREKNNASMINPGGNKNGKRIRLKKKGKQDMPKKDRKSLSQIF